MTSQPPRPAAIATSALLVVIGVALVASSRANNASMLNPSLVALQVPQITLAVPTEEPRWLTPVGPTTTLPPQTPKPGETGVPTPFPIRALPPITPAIVGSEDFEAVPTTRPYTPLPTPRPEDPYGLDICADRIPGTIKYSYEFASVVVIGTVRQVDASRWTTPDGKRPANPWAADNRDFIFTPVLIQVESYLKGEQSHSELLLLAIGGTVGQDTVGLCGDKSNTFHTGERVVLFLNPARPTDQINAIGGRPLWRASERYTLTPDRNVTNGYSKLSLQQLLDEIKAAQSGIDPQP